MVQTSALRQSPTGGLTGSRAVAVRPARRLGALHVTAAVVAPGDTVLVAGATGGVGQLLTAKLLDRGFKVRAMTRSADKVEKLFGGAEGLSVALADMREPSSLSAALEGVDAVCCCTGTTAFPTMRWKGGNSPKETDLEGIRNLVRACPKSLKRFVLTTSAGVERPGQFPFSVLNTFGVLDYKRQGELELEASGIPYVIMRPNRLTDGPYTSYDINTLLKNTSGTRHRVDLSLKDEFTVGEASRIAVAEAIVQSMALDFVEGHKYALISREGDGPGQDAGKWRELFASVLPAGVA